MIFITLGNDKHRFKRIEEATFEIAQYFPHKNILFQYGHSKPVNLPNIENQKFINRSKFSALLNPNNVIISHAGAGTLLQCVKSKVVPFVIPRLKCYGEHVNDHQLDILNEFYDMGLCHKYVGVDRILELNRSLPFKKTYTSEYDRKTFIAAIRAAVVK